MFVLSAIPATGAVALGVRGLLVVGSVEGGAISLGRSVVPADSADPPPGGMDPGSNIPDPGDWAAGGVAWTLAAAGEAPDGR